MKTTFKLGASFLAFLLLFLLPNPASGNDLLFYGQFVQAVYDGLDAGNNTLEFIGNAARFDPADGYNITRLLYCTEKFGPSYFEESNSVWIGYIAHSKVKEDVAIVLRGTTKSIEWLKNLMIGQVPFQYINGSTPTNAQAPQVHAGFASLYNSFDPTQEFGKNSLRHQIMEELSSIVQSNNVSTVTLAGHSLGGAIAIMSSFDIAKSNISSSIKSGMRVYTFAAPMTGDHTFSTMAPNSVNILRVSDIRDIVPYLPSMNYEHTGSEMRVDGCEYPYPNDKFGGTSVLSRMRDYHHLGRYLNTVSQVEMATTKVPKRFPNNVGALLGDLKQLREIFGQLFGGSLWSVLHEYISNFTKPCPNGKVELRL